MVIEDPVVVLVVVVAEQLGFTPENTWLLLPPNPEPWLARTHKKTDGSPSYPYAHRTVQFSPKPL